MQAAWRLALCLTQIQRPHGLPGRRPERIRSFLAAILRASFEAICTSEGDGFGLRTRNQLAKINQLGIGAEVWGTGGDAGFTRDGTHAELIGVPVASLRRKPAALSFDQAAAVGVNYLAAWCGLEAAGLKAGEIVLLIGAGGGVGGAAAQIGRRLGARQTAPRPGGPIHAGNSLASCTQYSCNLSCQSLRST